MKEYFDKTFPGAPSTHPDTALLQFVSVLLEEFGDEWGNKWMYGACTLPHRPTAAPSHSPTVFHCVYGAFNYPTVLTSL